MKPIEHPYINEFFHFSKIKSTSAYATELIKTKQVSGNFIVIADEQTKGTGRQQNVWFSAYGGLWFTLGLERINVNTNFTLFCGIVLHKTIANFLPDLKDQVKIKWPNDIYLQSKKVAGIHTTFLSQWHYHLIGIGLNSNNLIDIPSLSEIAVSLHEFTGKNYSNRELLSYFISTFFEILPDFIENSLNKSYFDANDFLQGKKITLSTEFEEFTGMYKGVSHTGAIQIQLPNGSIQPFFSGSVIKVFI